MVDHVADGDTIAVTIGGRDEDVRLIGIDTPEVYFGVECGGRKASASIKRMIAPGDPVTLIRDRTQANRDRYDRLLRYVEVRGRDLGRKQASSPVRTGRGRRVVLASGAARAITCGRGSRAPPRWHAPL